MPLAVLGVDLASASWAANGTALLTFEPGGDWIGVDTAVVDWPTGGKPSVAQLAELIDAASRRTDAAAVSIDGPQGWRDPAGSGWGRQADRQARTPGKMGPPRSCVPGTYLRWVSFSVAVFAELLRRPQVRLVNEPNGAVEEPPTDGYYLVESFPTSTWRSAGLTPPPGKAKTSDAAPFARALARAFGLPPLDGIGHDDLQAVVAALPAAALLGAPARAVARGTPGRLVGEDWIEGLIWDAVPAREPLGAPRPDRAPLLVLVTGPPASGKSTLAKPLAEALRLPLVARDELKETLFGELGTGDVEWTRRLGRASFALLGVVARRLLEAGQGAVLEANFFRGASEAGIEELPPHRLVQVHCAALPEIVMARYARRPRHPGHLDADRAEEVAARLRDRTHDPLDLPGAVISVDTSEGVDVEALAEEVRRAATNRADGG